MYRTSLRRIVIAFAVSMAGLLGSTAAMAAPSQKAVDVLAAVRAANATELPGRARANSGVSGVVNAAAMSSPRVGLTLADGSRITAELQRVARDDRRNVQSWVGTFPDAPGSALVLTRAAGVLTGIVNYGSETLELLPTKGGRHVLFAVDTARLPQTDIVERNTAEGGDAVAVASDYGTGGSTLAAGAVVQDALVVYTAAAANAWGKAALESMIGSAVQSANQAYQNSQVGINLNMVGLQQVSLTEGSGMQATLTKLKQDAQVRQLRDSLGADMVVLVSQDSDWCGYASWSYSVGTSGTIAEHHAVVWSNCLSSQSLGHEVGHLQGLDHNRENAGSGSVYPYGFGYRMCVTGGFRDMMSYSCPTNSSVPRVLQFSNPSVYYNGYATGISYELDPSRSAEAARSLNNTATQIAGLRSPGGSTTPVATAPASPSGLAASSVAYNGVSLAWADNAGNETGYEVERSGDGVTYARIASLGADARSFADAGVSASRNYFYRVRAFNSVGFSAYSNTVSVTTPAAPVAVVAPTAPSSVSAANRADGSALVSWTNDATNATSYEVRRETWDSRKKTWGRSTLAATVPSSVASIIDTTNSGTFRYFVRATNSGGASAERGPAQVTVSGGKRTGKR